MAFIFRILSLSLQSCISVPLYIYIFVYFRVFNTNVSGPAPYNLPCVLYKVHTASASQSTVPPSPHFYTDASSRVSFTAPFFAMTPLLQGARSVLAFISGFGFFSGPQQQYMC